MSKKMKAIVVEDEPLAREGLIMYLKEISYVELVAICTNALEANKILGEQNVDLMFLDVQMPKLTGIDFLKSIKNPPIVIMTTAYPNYALQGYELDVIDYLVKPFPFDRFVKAVNKARDYFELKQTNTSEHRVEAPSEREYIFVKCDNKLEKIVLADMLYVSGMENYVVIHTKQQKYITLMRMKEIEEVLPASRFMRVHKSFIIHLPAIESIEGNELVLAGHRIPISRERRAEVLARLLK